MKFGKALCLALLLSVQYPQLSTANDEASGPLSSNIRALLSADVLHPANSSQNPDNAFLQLYRYAGELDLRPDFFLDTPYINGVFKPRFTAAYKWWEDGVPDGTRGSASRGFVNEWRVQGKATPMLFLSFGKEKMLWGPSFLASPSNILFADIEKINPKAEVEGKYLAKVIAAPDTTGTLSVISETEKEKNAFQEQIKPLRVLKADYTGSNYQISMIGYERQGDRFRFGSYGQWTASDGLVLYYDGIVTKGTDALYPVEDAGSPVGGEFGKKYDDSDRLLETVVAGGSYTFLSGSTLSMEFLVNEQGYNNKEADLYYRLRGNASNYFSDATFSGLSQKTLAEALNTGLPFLRKYYAMGQFQVREIHNVLDVIVRYIHCIEERSGQASSIVEWQVSDQVQLFNINILAIDHGGETEFNSLIDKSLLLGIEVHF
jgi:hypothetical protein